MKNYQMNKHMKICLITNEYPLDNQCYGAGYHTYYLAHSLSKKGHQVHIITFGKKQKTITQEKVQIHIITRSWPKLFNFLEKKLKITYFGTLHFLAISKTITKKLRELIEKRKIEIIEMPEGGGVGFVYFFKNLHKETPVLIKLHTPLYFQQKYNNHKLKLPFELLKKINKKLLTFMENYCIKQSNLLVSPSQFMTNKIAKAEIVHNGIDLNKFKPKEKTIIHKRKINLLFVGSISKYKGVDYLIETALLLKKKDINFQLKIIGKDCSIGAQKRSYTNWLNQKYNTTQHTDIIKFTGYKSHQEIIKAYQEADILLLTSRMDNFPTVILEAMACGTPTIAFNVGGVKEIIKNNHNGILIPPYDTELLAQKIQDLYNQPIELIKLHKNCINFRNNFSLEKNTEIMESLYKSLIQHQ